MRKSKKAKKALIYILELAIIVTVCHYLFTHVVQPITIVGDSMYPTLHDGDHALIIVSDVTEDDLERFDVVVIDWKANDEKIIKRIIGLPGDTVVYQNDKLYINGVLYEEDFLDRDYVATAMKQYDVDQFTADFEYTVPEGQYFVLGDNRLNSADSRTIGCFTIDDIVGKEGIVIYPFSHFDWIG